jgi:hypothetical protein
MKFYFEFTSTYTEFLQWSFQDEVDRLARYVKKTDAWLRAGSVTGIGRNGDTPPAFTRPKQRTIDAR